MGYQDAAVMAGATTGEAGGAAGERDDAAGEATAAPDEAGGADSVTDGAADAGTTDAVTDTEAPADDPLAPRSAELEGTTFTRYHVGTDLTEAAADLLEGHQEDGPTVLAHAGYLDLLGNVWGCVVQGDGWVEVDVVQQDGEESIVSVIRMDEDAWEESYEMDT